MKNSIRTIILGCASIVGLALTAGAGMAQSPEHGIVVSSCVGYWGGANNCVVEWRDNPGNPHIIHIRAPRDEREEAEASARERKWVERCRPVVRQDRYGVNRAYYAKPGCEFGKSED